MFRYIIRRILLSIPIFLGTTVLVFILVNNVPGGELGAYITGPQRHLTASQITAIRHNFGLDQPPVTRYFLWLWSFVHGDFGYSTQNGLSVSEEILSHLSPTIMLIGAAFLLQELVAIPLGIYSALKKYSLFDHAFTVFTYGAYALPTFWFGLILIMVLGVHFPIFPFGGMVDVRVSPPWGTSDYHAYFLQYPLAAISDLFMHLVLPVVVLALTGFAVDSRLMRSSMLGVMKQEYIKVARAKGLPERTVVFKHALRNAILPVITNIGLTMPGLFAGAIVTEQIFSWPGMGSYFVQAALSSDYPVVLAYSSILAALTIFFNLLTDIAYIWIDPRIKYT